MSSEEKRTWISALVGVVVPVAYLASILSKVAGTDVARIAYVGPMLTSIGIGIGILEVMHTPQRLARIEKEPRCTR